MPKRDDQLLFDDIIENMVSIFEFTASLSYGEFIKDKMRVLAVIRCFEVIAKQLIWFLKI